MINVLGPPRRWWESHVRHPCAFRRSPLHCKADGWTRDTVMTSAGIVLTSALFCLSKKKEEDSLNSHYADFYEI
ncbi:hypothetical protein F2P81_001244 [Scophthalmus maximus]|uniref:Uncharacterized protein n=1 Tax=Scophthalmus maximus TaxID=52904 RepID=A0A6A4TYP9_SCOMX|nr:hypothetical protein F2P81_001244 [Scophthalmus maximus]